MNSKKLSPQAIGIIDNYINFRISNAKCSIPYFNNKTKGSRLSLAVKIGKGKPSEIQEEVNSIIIKNRVDKSSLSNNDLQKILTENNLGIDCSGLAYHILDAEIFTTTKRHLNEKLHFSGNLINKIRSKIRPTENTNVSVFSSNENSKIIKLSEVTPGDFISIMDNDQTIIRDHILVIYQVDFENSIPKTIYYIHSIAYPQEKPSQTGVRQNKIDIHDINTPITQAKWSEQELFNRIQKSKTELRRLK